MINNPKNIALHIIITIWALTYMLYDTIGRLAMNIQCMRYHSNAKISQCTVAISSNIMIMTAEFYDF